MLDDGHLSPLIERNIWLDTLKSLWLSRACLFGHKVLLLGGLLSHRIAKKYSSCGQKADGSLRHPE